MKQDRPLVVLVAFEGPDRYSFVGGLATRMNDLADALVARDYAVHHLFVGDPKAPASETRLDGKLTLERWCQWISAYHPKDVYDGETGKWLDFSRTVPPRLVEIIEARAARSGRAVVLFEDWQTAAAAVGTATRLRIAGLRRAASLFWNANNTYGFGNVAFPALDREVTITTISRFMRTQMTGIGIDPAILPNGIAERFLAPLPSTDLRQMRAGFGERPTFVKVARFDPDKRWIWAVDAIAALRDMGMRPRFVMRGSRADYAAVVDQRITTQRLSVDRFKLAAEAPVREVAERIAASPADIVFLDSFVSERALRALYAAADGVLANSDKEPFGLVGLEVMASGGIAYLGRTGEDYAVPYGNAVVVQTDDPRELATHLGTVRADPELASRMRSEGRATARRFTWPKILDSYEVAWETAMRLGR